MKTEILNPVITEQEALNMVETWRRGKGKGISEVWKQPAAPTGAVRKRDFSNVKRIKNNGNI